MNTYAVWLAGGAAAYVLGSIPFGFLLAKLAGVDIRKVGSGNIGATNVYRSVSKPLGLLTFLLDFLKGLAGALAVPALCRKGIGGCGCPEVYFSLFCGVLAVFGHSWTCFLGFKGGKGVAASAGMLLGVAPAAVGIAFSVWLLVLLISRYMSVASMSGAAALAVAVWPLYLHGGAVLPAVLTALALLVIWKHRSNIKRLLAGAEPHFRFRKG